MNSVLSGRMNASSGGRILQSIRVRRRSKASPMSTRRRRMPRGSSAFTGDFSILKPVDPGRGNRRIFFDYGNRGNKRMLQFFNDAPASTTRAAWRTRETAFSMRRGYTVGWLAWQGDLLPGNGRMVLDLPDRPGGHGTRPGRVHRRSPRDHDVSAERSCLDAQPSGDIARPARSVPDAAALSRRPADPGAARELALRAHRRRGWPRQPRRRAGADPVGRAHSHPERL